MYGILCKKDGDYRKTIPIMKGDEETGDDTGVMATWSTVEEAQDFARENLLCQVSATIIIDLKNEEIY